MTASVPFFILDSPLGQVLRPKFQAGLTFGLVGLGLVLLAGALLRLSSRSTGPIPIAELVVVGAGVAALSQTERLPDGLAPGLGALLLGAWLTASTTDLPEVGWIRVLVLASAVVGGTLLSDFDSRWCRRGLGPVLLAVSMLGIYATVPDTEQALVVLGLALPLALTSWPWPVASLGVAGRWPPPV
ncbi:MAG: hypothetical protein H0X58_07125 [Acidimicrobiia bacterium]|nr:hypothetical protein [Acidimicrobiia bacterium]